MRKGHPPKLGAVAALVLLVDVVIPGWVPFRSWTVAADAVGMLAAHDQLLEYAADGADTFVGGHLTRLGDRGDVETTRSYLRDVLDTTASVMGSTRVQDVIAEFTEAPGRPSGQRVPRRRHLV